MLFGSVGCADSRLAEEELLAFRGDLDAYRVAVETIHTAPSLGTELTGDNRQRISRRLPVIMELAKRLDLPDSERISDWNYVGKIYEAISAVDELIGIIQQVELVERIFGPEGPRLSAASLHPWVWGVAAGLWDNGFYRLAVQEAATLLLDSHLPAKLGVPRGSITADPAKAFSLDPPAPDQPRLRLDRYAEGSDDWKSLHEGAKFLGMTCRKLIRNLTVHDTDHLDEYIALESLAILSAFARLLEAAVVVT